MVSLYYLDINKINPDNEHELLSGLSEYRQKKVEKLKAPMARKLSLGAGLVTDYGLRKYGLKESQMIYSFGSNNKPYFKNEQSIFFNISHSNNFVMAAFSDTEVGCDIEAIKSARLKVGNRFFSESEKTLINSLKNEEEQNEMFFRIWTLKESYVKYTGKGLAEDFRSFNVFEKGFAGENIDTYEYAGISGYRAACCFEKNGAREPSIINELIGGVDFSKW